MPRQCIRHHFAAASGWSRAARRLALFLLSGLSFTAASSVAVLAQEARQAASPVHDPAAAHVAEAALRFGIPEGWIRAVLHTESGGDPTAISSAGAMGLMQVMPETWGELRSRYRLGDDPFDPRDNILAGTAYLREMFDRYGNTGAMLAAYNAGPARYDAYLGEARELPAETRAYVAVLAPLLGGEPLPPGAAGTPARVTDWREASLFVAMLADTRAAPEMRDERTANVAPDSPSALIYTLTPASAEALFVTISPAGDAP